MVMLSDGFCRLTEYRRETLIGRNCRFLQGPATDPEAVNLLRGQSSISSGCSESDQTQGPSKRVESIVRC